MTQPQTNPPFEKKIIIVTSTKSVGIAILLTFLFGPLGMFYSTILGAIIMLIVTIGGLLSMVIFPFNFFGIPLILIWPVSIIWGALAAHFYNKRLLRAASPHII